MHIAFAASECVPFSKTGGLADVVGALPRALAAHGHKVTVYLPRYRQTRLENARCVVPSITVPFDDRYRFCSILDGGTRDNVQFYFIDYPPFFDREGLYGTALGDYHDNAERFALFCRAVIEGSKILGVPSLFHCHDWQAGLVPILLRSLYHDDPVFRNVAAVFTIHNIGYQGLFAPDTLPLLMLPWDLFTLAKLEFYGKVNLLKGALVYADYITTVSRRYCQEIQTVEFGSGLEGVLRNRNNVLTGILNGVDYSQWSPETDSLLPANYSIEMLENKAVCKRELLAEFGFNEAAELAAMAAAEKTRPPAAPPAAGAIPPKGTSAVPPPPTAKPRAAGAGIPVVGIISRFAAQKGFDLIAQVADRIAREDLVVVALGTGNREYEELFRRLQKQYPKKFLVKIAYDERLAHRIEAGADIFLMPSRYEPCGLNQIYSLRYGTVPVVRATGGLDDTIEPWDPATGKGTGFKFAEYTGEAMLEALHKALAAYRDRAGWQKLMRNGMARDFSWTNSAKEYGKVYEKARGIRIANQNEAEESNTSRSGLDKVPSARKSN